MSNDSPDGPVRITLAKVYEKVEDQEDTLSEMAKNVALLVQEVRQYSTAQADQETRLRSLEAFRSQAKGVAAVVLAVVLPALGFVVVRVLS